MTCIKKTLQSKMKAYSKQWNLQETELRGVDSCRHHDHRMTIDDKEDDED